MDAQSPPVSQRSPNSAAISSSCYRAGNHEVFISFRGSDVRRGFLEHLFRALKFKQISAFIDDDLERGKNIISCLFQVIEKSDLSIVIFSQNYPKSEWCMEELRKIHDSMMDRKQRVIPVFYEVDPSHVQDQQGNYAIEKQKWRDALKEIGNLSGFDSKNYSNDAELIDDIVDNVSMILLEICQTISHNGGLFGIVSSIKDVEKLLQLDSRNDVRMVGIWGMGGIGKTTITSQVSGRNKKKFSGSCFVSNVRETLSTRDGLISLRDKIIRELLGDKDIKIDSSPLVDYSIRKRIKRTEILLVLDDVLTCKQLRSLMETIGLYYPDSLCPGSRIVVTSRDAQVLRDVIFKSGIYEATELKDAEALHLLSWHAFGQKNPPQGYEKLAEEVVQYVHGVPLALIVVGSELKYKSTSQWRDALKKLNSISPFEIHKILRTSFDEFDRDEKNIFLDIACFLKGYDRDYVVNVLDDLGFHERMGIDRLIDKSLLKEENKEGTIIITMHDLLEQMGQEILIEEKESKRHQSRLLTFNEIKDAFANDKN